ncbi:thiamine pyrophosphate-binding protein [Castellaniella sp.]|uniref:thiamine pyrophosphate-binding protein n=1 Tax=Castellaniella sp. TaxID=1955812 RepID=UPI00356461CC
MKVCDIIAKWCEDIDTPFVAGIPASGMLEIIESLAQKEKDPIPFVLTRHEQGAAMMACSYAFHTGRPAVVMASKAPGATNLAIGVMSAYIESIPMIILTQQVSNEHELLEAFEEIDLAEFFKSITKWSVQANNPRRINSLLNEAYTRAMSGRKGPVHVALPYNFMNVDVGPYVAPVLPSATAAVSAGSLARISQALTGAKRPLIIAGGGVRSETQNDVTGLAEALNAPIVASWLRKPVSDAHPNLVGMAGIGGSPAAYSAIKNADVVLTLGCRFSEQMTEHYRMRFAPDVRLIHVDLDPAVISRVFPAEFGVVGDMADVLPLLRQALPARSDDPQVAQWLAGLQKQHAEYRAQLDAQATDPSAVGGREVARELRRALPADTKLVLDSGNYLHWAEQFFLVESAGQFHYPTSGAMGFGIPGAIGAKIASPDSFVCALVGDGGFAMTMGELETARRLDVPILVVIVNNAMLGHIRMRQDSRYGRSFGSVFTKQHLARVADAFEIESAEVSTLAEFRDAVARGVELVNAGKSMLIDAHVTDELAPGPLDPWWKD